MTYTLKANSLNFKTTLIHPYDNVFNVRTKCLMPFKQGITNTLALPIDKMLSQDLVHLPTVSTL